MHEVTGTLVELASLNKLSTQIDPGLMFSDLQWIQHCFRELRSIE